MTIHVSRENNQLTVQPVGRIDTATSGEFGETLRREITPDTVSLTVNMKEVDFISSMGLRMLVNAYRIMGGKPVMITQANTSVLEVLRLSGMLNIFKVNEP